MVLLMTVLKLIFWDQVFLIYACISIILCLINTIKTFTIFGYNNTKISEALSKLQNVVGQASFIFYRGDKNTATGGKNHDETK